MTLEPLISASPAIQVHVAAAVAAFVLGGVVLFRRKGGRTHMMLGRVWVLLMLVVVFSSLFIHTIRLWGIWSPIHLLSVGAFVSLVYGVAMIRRRNVSAHKRTMQGTYLGALVIAGFFTFMPGRIMHEVLLSGTSPTELALICVAAAGLTAWVIWRGGSHRPTVPA
ncbi:MAG: DUF2306 domain-containing protein [Rhizobiaceae bacterium]